MRTTDRTSRNRIALRRPRRLTRPVAVLVAVLVGLGGLGGAAGAVLGELGAAHPGHELTGWHGRGHHDDGDDGPGVPFER